MTDIPTISTDRLFLRSFKLEDVPRLVELAGDRAVAETYAKIPHLFEDAAIYGILRGEYHNS